MSWERFIEGIGIGIFLFVIALFIVPLDNGMGMGWSPPYGIQIIIRIVNKIRGKSK